MAFESRGVSTEEFLTSYPAFLILPEENVKYLIDIIEEVANATLIDFDTVAQRFSDSLKEGEIRFAV